MTALRQLSPLPLLPLFTGLPVLAAGLLAIPWAVQGQGQGQEATPAAGASGSTQRSNPPTKPTGLAAPTVDESISLPWDASAEDAESVTGYEVSRAPETRGGDTRAVFAATAATAATEAGPSESAHWVPGYEIEGAFYDGASAATAGESYTPTPNGATRGLLTLAKIGGPGDTDSPEPPWFAAANRLQTAQPTTTPVSDTGQSAVPTATISHQHATRYRPGSHGQGYSLSSVPLEPDAAPSPLTVSLRAGGHGFATPSYRLFDFDHPSSFAMGLNEFTAPAGAFAYHNNHCRTVPSGLGSSPSIKETTSEDEEQVSRISPAQQRRPGKWAHLLVAGRLLSCRALAVPPPPRVFAL